MRICHSLYFPSAGVIEIDEATANFMDQASIIELKVAAAASELSKNILFSRGLSEANIVITFIYLYCIIYDNFLWY